MASLDSKTKILNIEQQIEAETIETKDYFFCKVGESIPLMSDGSIFDGQNPPLNPLVVSQRLGLVFAAHSSGFCVAKIKDVVAAAEAIKEKGSGGSVQELSVVDVHCGRVSILTLSIDSSFVAAVVDGEIQCFSVESLLNQDQKPVFCCPVELNHVKDMFWIKESEPSFIVLSNGGTLHLGTINKTLKQVMDGVDAVGRNEDGDLIAIGRKNYLSIFSLQFDEIFQVVIPMDTWSDESNTIKVDSIKWARSDSIVVGCFQQTEDGKEENYFMQVIMNKDGHLINDTLNLISVDLNNLFPGIVDDVVPCGCGPHLYVNYLRNGGFAIVSNRKNTDEHIMLFDWTQGDNQVSVVYIDRDTWLPRIELQESGDDNLILGFCVDESSVYENVKVIVGLEDERELLPHCLLLCLTLEGKFVMFKVASFAGPQRSSEAFSTTSNAQSISAVGNSIIGGASLRLEEKGAKQPAFNLELHKPDAIKNSSAPDEAPLGKDQKQLEQNEHTVGTSIFDQTTRREVIVGSSSQKPLTDVDYSKAFRQSGQSQESLNSAGGDIGTEKRNTEHVVLKTDKFLDKNLTNSGWGVEEKNGSVGLNSTPSITTPSTSLGNSGVSNARSLFSSPAFPQSTLSGDLVASTYASNRSGNLSGNSGSHPFNTFSSATGKALNFSQQPITSSSNSEMPLSVPSSKTQLQEIGKLQNFTSQNVHKMSGSDKMSSHFGQTNSEQNLPKQFSNVQNMANELDKLLKSIEEAGGYRDICTAAHRSSIKSLEEGIDSLSESNRLWQSCMEDRLIEMQLLLDKTVQVMARKTHMEGIVRQTTDGQYWELWNRQKLNPELDQKQLNVLNKNQDLINRMIELEKHFNTLELNLFGESSGKHLVSRALNSRSVPSRHSQSLHAIHNATVSQLAAAKQLSDSLSKQMDVLSIKSPPTKQASVKRQVFESIGMPYPDDSLCSPSTAKLDSPSNRHPSVSRSAGTHADFKKIHLSGVSSHDLETARRRRDSLDRNWANFEAPKTTVKRMVVQNEPQKVGSLFSSVDKQFVSPGKLERPIANYSKALAGHVRNGTPQNLNSDAAAASKFKPSDSIHELSQSGTEQSFRLQLFQGESISASQNRSSSLLTTFVDPNMKKGSILSTAERPGAQIGNIDRSDRSVTASVDTKPSVLQFTEGKSTTEKIQPQPFSFQIGDRASISGSKETELTKPVDGQIFSEVSTSTHDAEASSSVFPPVSSSSLPNLRMQSSSIKAVEGGSNACTKRAENSNNEVLQSSSSAVSVSSSFGASSSSLTTRDSKEVLRFPSSLSVSASQATPVTSLSSKGTEVVDSNSTESSEKPTIEPLKIGLQSAANKESAGKSASTSSEVFNFANLSPSLSSTDLPKTLALSPDIKKSATHASGSVSNAPDKQHATVASSSVFASELGGSFGEKSNTDATVSQEDEMEEEAPETNQTAQNSLGSFAGFGIGSTPSATAPKSSPFGGSITSASQALPSSISLTVPSGELFRPASFSFQPLQASQPSQTPNIGAPNAFNFANTPHQVSSGSGFGQPSQIGSGQQALGSVLGSFGQSRQLGAGLPGSGFGVSHSPGGGFLNSNTSGFGGGFATAATGGGGFASAAPSGGGFAAAAAPSGGGFAAASGGAGGFGGFGKAGTSGFSGFGGSAGGRQAPSELFTQMRK